MKKANPKGITLIALVITIIVMLILVTVTVQFALDDNGIIKNSKKVSELTGIEADKESLENYLLGKDMYNIITGDFNLEQLGDKLGDDWNPDLNSEKTELKVIGKQSKKIFVINLNGEIALDENNDSDFIEEPKPVSRLPEEYQEVEYLESTGTQYINSNYICKATSKIVVDFKYTKIQSSGAITGVVYNYGERKNVAFATSIDTTAWALQYEDVNGVKIGMADTERHTIEIDIKNGNLTMDNSILYSWTPQGKLASIPIYIFARNGQTAGKFIDEYSSSKIFSYKIYEDSNCVMDLVPCYRKSNNAAGMYDIVNGVFYTNAGSGTFSYREDA